MSSSSSPTSGLKRVCTTRSLTLLVVLVTCALVVLKVNQLSVPQGDSTNQQLAQSNPQPVQVNHHEFFHGISHYPVMHSSPGLQLYIYTAFLDQRHGKTILRIFALEKKGGVSVKFRCRYNIRYTKTGVETTKEVVAKRLWIDEGWPEWSPYFASEYNCLLPRLTGLNVITLVSSDGRSYKFQLPVESLQQYSTSQRSDLAVCIKPMTGRYDATKMIEWIETLKAIGYQHIIIYQTDVTGPARHVLEYYQQNGLVKIIDFPFLLSSLQAVESPKLTSEQRFAIYQQIYLIAINDCLYRFSSLYKYLAIQDVDEIIAPRKNESISKMLARAERLYPKAGGFLFRTYWYWEDFGADNDAENKLLYMQKYHKSTSPQNNQPKSIVSTDRAITVNFHSVLDVPNKDFQNMVLSPKEFGGVHHYRGKCRDKFNKEVCHKMLADKQDYKIMRRYRDVVKQRVQFMVTHFKMS